MEEAGQPRAKIGPHHMANSSVFSERRQERKSKEEALMNGWTCLGAHLGEERGCPSFCHSMVRAGDASTVQGSLTLSPTLTSTTVGSFLSIFNLQSPQAEQKM